MNAPQYTKEKPETIQAMFGSIAKSYDRTNGVLSMQLHKRWNAELIKRVMEPSHPKAILDLCCGTGEIAFTYLRKTSKPCRAYLLDFCKEMLDCARMKAKKLALDSHHNISYLHADAQIIPLADNSVDCVTIAYGIRNVKDPANCMREVLRVLRPGGTFGILELTQPTNPLLRFGHTLYLRTLLPILGWLFSSNKGAYNYLRRSIQAFIKPIKLEKTLLQTGFRHTAIIPLWGGIATILIAKKIE